MNGQNPSGTLKNCGNKLENGYTYMFGIMRMKKEEDILFEATITKSH